VAPRANNPDGTIPFRELGLRYSALPTTLENIGTGRQTESVVIERLTLGYFLVLSQARAHFGALTSGVSRFANHLCDHRCAGADIWPRTKWAPEAIAWLGLNACGPPLGSERGNDGAE